jgi:restriction system protein
MPRRKRSVADDLILGPWWINLALAVIAYVVLSRVMPTLAPLVCFILIAFAAISALRALANRQMLDRQTGIESLRELPWKHFEDLLGEAYRRQGYKVTENLGRGPDGGVDLVLRRDGKVTLVQCKRWKDRPVQVQTVRELYGVLIDRQVAGAKLVTTSFFTSEAIAFARGKPIDLVDSNRLLVLLRGVQTSGRIAAREFSDHDAAVEAPLCPACNSKMVIRVARRGSNQGSKFWGCPGYPNCRGTRPFVD